MPSYGYRASLPRAMLIITQAQNPCGTCNTYFWRKLLFMDLKGILSISGNPGLYKLVGQMKGGLIVESLTDGKRVPAYTTQRILALEDISIYTDKDDVPLTQVYADLIAKTGGKASLDPKTASIEKLQAELASVLPNYDRDRVYTSDLKKLFIWFNQLVEKGLIAPEEKKAEEKKAKKAEKEEGETAAKKPAKKAKGGEK